MIEITLKELAERAMRASENGAPVFFKRRDDREQEEYDCFVASIAIADTYCLLVSHVGEGSASALNVTTYSEDLGSVVNWLSEFCMGDVILAAKPPRIPRPGRM
jgi:hypothetical protein